MKFPFKAFEKAFAFVILFFATSPFYSNVEGTALGVPKALMYSRALWFGIFIVVALYSMSQFRQVTRVLLLNKALFLFTIFAILSTIWSQDPEYTLRHSVTLFGSTLVGVYLSRRFSVHEQVHLLCFALTLGIALSVFGELFAPGILPASVASGQDPDVAGWHGIFAHKNILGRLAALELVALLSLRPRLRGNLLFTAGVLGIATVVIIKAHSMSALIVAVVTVAAMKILPVLHWRPRKFFLASMAAGIAAASGLYLLVANLASVTALFGRDATLTGRTTLWAFLLNEIKLHPVGGVGFEAFWLSSTAERIRGASWGAMHAHNGFIDMTLSLGFVGLLLFLTAYAVTMSRAVRRFRTDPGPDSVWALAILIFMFVCQISESIFGSWNPLFWLLFVATAAAVSQPDLVAESATNIRNRGKAAPLYAVGEARPL